jgi:hypothetical protein
MHFEGIARHRIPGLWFVAVIVFYFTTAWVGGPASNWRGQTPEYYALLTDAFLAGQTSLLVQPPAELLALPNPYDPIRNAEYRLHDASLYRGKYYLYFGPTPALVLFLPFKVLTGSHLPSRVAVALFCAGGFACSCALFFLLAKLEKWDIPAWFASAVVISLGTAPGVIFLLAHTSFYEVAIAAGYCFVMAGFLLAAYSLGQRRPRVSSLAGAGLCFGLAVGCRPNYAPFTMLMVVLVTLWIRSPKMPALAYVGPVVLCGVLLAVYNYARFQNPFEFGLRYQLYAKPSDPADLVNRLNHSLASLLPGLYTLVLSPPSEWLCWFHRSMGVLWGAPTALLGLCAPFVLRFGGVKGAIKPGSTRFVIYCIYVCVLSTLVVLALLGYAVGRYTVDFAPELVLLSWCLLAAGWQGLHQLAKTWVVPFRLAVVGIAFYSAALGIFMSVLLLHYNVLCR